jgi:dolichol-phosphate mannosyltransferase
MKVLVLVVTYNEAANIRKLIAAILTHLPDASVLVVDDNSPDGTTGIVRAIEMGNPRIHIMTRTGERGYGSATIAGLRYGVENGHEAIVTLDADFSHDPADLPRLIDALSAADVSIGSRYVGGIRVLNWGVSRLLLSLGANAYVRFLSGLSAMDCTSGFRAYRVDALKKVPFESISATGYSFLPELLFAFHTARVTEVPVCYTERRVGESKMGNGVILEAVIRPWILLGRRFSRARRG